MKFFNADKSGINNSDKYARKATPIRIVINMHVAHTYFFNASVSTKRYYGV